MNKAYMSEWQPLLDPWHPIPWLIMNRKGQLKGGNPLGIESLSWPANSWPNHLEQIANPELWSWFSSLSENEWVLPGKVYYWSCEDVIALELDQNHIALLFLQGKWKILGSDGEKGIGLEMSEGHEKQVAGDAKTIWSPSENAFVYLVPIQEQLLTPAFLSPQWRSILESTPAGAVIADHRGTVIHVNSAFERVTGFSGAEVVGRRMEWNYLKPEDRQAVQEGWEQVKVGVPWQADLEAYHRNGTIYPEKVTIWPIPEDDGQINHCMVFKEDVSQIVSWKKELEIRDKKLQEVAEIIPQARLNEARYHSIIQASQTGAWEYNLETQTLWISEEYYAMLGIIPESTQGESYFGYERWLSLVHPEDRYQAAKAFKDYLESDRKEVYVNFFRMIHTSGEPIWVLSRGQEVKTIDGSPTPLVLGVHINITDLKKAEQIIKDRDFYHQALLELIPDMLLVVDKDGVCLDFKPGHVDLLAPPDVFLGKRLDQVISPEIANLHKKSAEKALAHQKMEAITYSASFGEETRHYRSTIVAFGPDKTLSSIRDITDDINRIQQLERLLAVEEKQNKQLHEFAHIVSHHFRSQVSGILGLLHIMSIEDPKRYQHLDIQFIQKASDQLQTTTDHLSQILNMRRNSEGKWKTFDLVALLEELVQGKHAKLQDVGGTLEWDRPQASWYLHSVPEYVQSILRELILNAIRFRALHRPLTLHISLKVIAKTYLIKVQDNGQGMDERTQSQIFSMYKSYNQGAESFQGLGLFIAQHQAEVLGGTLRVSSVVDTGTTFVLSLPREL